jgi:hypothetical protein
MCLLLALFPFKGRRGCQRSCGWKVLTRFQHLYQLTDAQLLEVAQIFYKGEYASLWAGLLPAYLSLHDFKDLFKAEFWG